MGRPLIFRRAASLAFQFAGGFGFIRVRWIDDRVMLGEHPVDPWFIETASVLLFTIGVFAFVGLSWIWISEWRWVKALLTSNPSIFHHLYDEIVKLRDDLVAVIDGNVSSLNYSARLWELSVSLNRLGIACPDRPPSLTTAREKRLEPFVLWYIFLISLAAQSRVYDLKGARLALKKVHQHAEGYDFENFLKDIK